MLYATLKHGPLAYVTMVSYAYGIPYHATMPWLFRALFRFFLECHSLIVGVVVSIVLPGALFCCLFWLLLLR